jgi:hypothetical protein
VLCTPEDVEAARNGEEPFLSSILRTGVIIPRRIRAQSFSVR